MTTAGASAIPTRTIHHHPGSRLIAAHLLAAQASHGSPSPTPANTNTLPGARSGSRTLAAALLASANRPPPTPVPGVAGGQPGTPTPKDTAARQHVAPRPVMSKEEREAREAEVQDAKALRISAARQSAAAFCEYVLKDEGSLGEITLARAQEELHQFCDDHTQVVFWAHVEFGKALALDTPIPTPSGWTTMGELVAGDTVFDSFGKPCRVTEATPVMHDHRVYRVTFDDGDSLLADADHRWIARAVDDAQSGPDGWRVVTTKEMLAAGGEWQIPVADPVQYARRPLPVDPYAIGARLGAGDHIPELYLTASVEQRQALLAGMLDTAGTVGEQGDVSFCNTSQALAEDVLLLTRSLGFKATLTSLAGPNGCGGDTTYRVDFRRISYKSVVSIEPVPSVPVRCIAVDSPNHSYLAGRGYTVTHNSSLVSVGRVLWELGKNPNLRIAIVSETDSKAKKLLRGIRRYLLNSRELREVFPHLTRSRNKDEPWNAHAVTVQRESFARDPSIQVTGVGGSIIGARIDLLILDDILSHRTALTKGAQEKLLSWYASNCAGRMTEHGRIIAVGTPWSKSDMYHTLAKTPGWVSKKFPVIDPATGLPTWPANWSLERIAKARQRLGPIEAARQLDCEPSDESTNRFQEDWIRKSLENGDGYDFIVSWADLFEEDVPPHLQHLPEGAFTVTGVDIGASMRSTGGLTVLTTLVVYANGERQILCIESGRWTGPQILQRCFETHARYRSTVFVEDNGAQKFLIDFAMAMGLTEIPPIRPHTTGRNKHDPTFGVESIATEMFQGRWTFPNVNNGGVIHEEMAALLKEMRDYNPDDHMGDRVSSLWIANMGAHTLRTAPGTNQVRARAFAPMDNDKREYDL